MAKILDLVAQPRTAAGTGAVNRLRKSGVTPAVVYGRKVAPVNVQVDTKTFTKILQGSASDNILVSLKLESGEQLALVQEVQHDHLKGGISHVDFHAIAMDEEIHAEVPVEIVGESPGVKFGGLVEAIHHNLEVRCLPKDLPEHITVDVSGLELGKAIHVGDIQYPEGVRPRLAADVVVLMCVEPKVDAEAEAAAAAPAAAPAAKGAAAAKPAAKK
ncbi:MAG: 50S ribosomal protein L25 [Prosthecobacter sp.]|jgi:large subunit ribosomal protein L25|nr:50S ribosomal protein L25 [Prosthecobacter sp.]